MRTLIALLLLAAHASALAQASEFTTAAAKAAKAAYEADLKAAREKYAAALDQAAVAAAADGDLDEVVRIKAEKDSLAVTATGSVESAPQTRVLWKHKHGFFEKLNDGHWIERVGDGAANIFVEVSRNEEFVEISRVTRTKCIVRLYDNRTEALFIGDGKNKFEPLHRVGGWAERPAAVVMTRESN